MLKGMKEQGTVKWFSDGKGFGFIAANRPEGAVDVFVHFSGIDNNGLRTLNSGQCVEFEVKPGPKGLMAEGVRSC
jgi:CspA family cold shock protein